MNLYQIITDKQLRKAINQWYRNCLQNFNRLKIRFNRLFISAAKSELKQTIIRREGERDLHNQFYTGSPNLELHPVLRTTSEFH